MTDDSTPNPDGQGREDADDVLADDELLTLLSDPGVWDEADPADELAILAAIGEATNESARGVPTTPPATAEQSNVVAISSARRWVGPIVAGVAAAIVVLVGASVFTTSDDADGIELVLAATDLAPEAEGVAVLADTPNGTRIILDVSGLPPAPEGSYYEAWVRKDAEVGVSAGTFHLRGGGGDIELWAGVSTDNYPLFTVTIQDEADVASSGRVVLRGLVGN